MNPAHLFRRRSPGAGRLVALLALGVAGGRFGATAVAAGPRLIPQPWGVRFAWSDAARDPFLDGERRGNAALLGNRPALAPATAPIGYGLKDFLDDLNSASGAEFKVQGILPGTRDGARSVAVINGQSYAEGDLVPARATTRDFESFAALARAKNITFERATGASAGGARGLGPVTAAPPGRPGQPAPVDVIVLLQMGRVLPPDDRGPGSIGLCVPGYTSPVAYVPYRFTPRFSRSTNKGPAANEGQRP